MTEDAQARVTALLKDSSLSPEEKATVLGEADIMHQQKLIHPAAVAGVSIEQLTAAGVSLGVASLLKQAFPGV